MKYIISNLIKQKTLTEVLVSEKKTGSARGQCFSALAQAAVSRFSPMLMINPLMWLALAHLQGKKLPKMPPLKDKEQFVPSFSPPLLLSVTKQFLFLDFCLDNLHKNITSNSKTLILLHFVVQGTIHPHDLSVFYLRNIFNMP